MFTFHSKVPPCPQTAVGYNMPRKTLHAIHTLFLCFLDVSRGIDKLKIRNCKSSQASLVFLKTGHFYSVVWIHPYAPTRFKSQLEKQTESPTICKITFVRGAAASYFIWFCHPHWTCANIPLLPKHCGWSSLTPSWHISSKCSKASFLKKRSFSPGSNFE